MRGPGTPSLSEWSIEQIWPRGEGGVPCDHWVQGLPGIPGTTEAREGAEALRAPPMSAMLLGKTYPRPPVFASRYPLLTTGQLPLPGVIGYDKFSSPFHYIDG